jgi:ArsR family transcriptional regulator
MEKNFDYASVFKALGDETRLKIIELLSCGELCACQILEYFNITQPTLSYHMKILTECGLLTSKKEGSWIKYRNNLELIQEVKNYWENISSAKEDCICKDLKESRNCE